jgi:hypothetical protein
LIRAGAAAIAPRSLSTSAAGWIDLMNTEVLAKLGRLIASLTSLLLLGGLLLAPEAQAQTYQSASTTFNWIDTATHTRIGYNTVPYKFNGGGSTGCEIGRASCRERVS